MSAVERKPRTERPSARQIQGIAKDRPIPLRTLPLATGGELSLAAWQGRYAAAALFAHDAACDVCRRYARELALQVHPLREADAKPLVVVRDTPDAARGWADELGEGVALLADGAEEWTRTVQPAFTADPDGVLLLMLDQYAAPRVVSVASDADGLIRAEEATEWLRFLALECPECGNDVRWPD